jgi:MoxR-like ATPase
MTHPEIDPAAEARRALEAALYECKRVVVGQDAMLERLLVALLTGGHVLLEGVPGLAKTLTVRTLATVLGGRFSRIQFTPDLVPADLVGTRVWQPGDGSFATELGPVFANLLLADEINRAPAKVQSALLEVMQEHQVTIGRETFRVPEPFLVMATENPIESEGTYPLPEAQVDRFMMKVVVDYPSRAEEHAIVDRALTPPEPPQPMLTTEDLMLMRERVKEVYVDPAIVDYAVRLVAATRTPAQAGLGELERYVTYGASPRASIALVVGARALAFLRDREYVLPHDVKELALDVLRHRVVLSYEALADDVDGDTIINRVLGAVRAPEVVLQNR